jgi:hypothetical protein
MLGELYVLILAGLIPFFSWQQREEGRNYVSMIVTGLFMILWLCTGTVPIVWDTTTILVLCFAMWMIASIFWSYSRQSSLDLYSLMVGLVIFLAARRISLPVLMPILFIPGVIFAAAVIWYRKADHPKKKWFIFGNDNHIGAFLLVPLFAGAWLTFNLSWWIAPLVVVIAVAMAINRCRGAKLGALVGLMYVACMQTAWALCLIPVCAVAVLVVMYYRKYDSRFVNLFHRETLTLAALYLIKRAPLAGHGLRTFRREYPAIVPELVKSKFYHDGYPTEGRTSHRIHNDHLELIMELGIIGYILFISIFSSLLWAANPLFAGAVIAFAVHGLFFFPLREAHTANPFFALAGAMAPTSAAVMAFHPLIATAFVLIVGRILWIIITRTFGLSQYDLATKIAVTPMPQSKQEKALLAQRQGFINAAIRCDPYNNVYLTEGYYYNVFDNPEQAFQYASRCMENYDGGKVRWGVCDQYARALLRLGGFGVVKMAARYALHICPTFKQTIELMQQVEQMEHPKTA